MHRTIVQLALLLPVLIDWCVTSQNGFLQISSPVVLPSELFVRSRATTSVAVWQFSTASDFSVLLKQTWQTSTSSGRCISVGIDLGAILKRQLRARAMADATRILSQIEAGDPAAAEKLLPLVYDELRKLAAAWLAQEKPGHTLQATALVHEAYLRLIGSEPTGQQWNSRGHFFAAAAEAMRRILVESARRKRRIRHGNEYQRVDLEGLNVAADAPSVDLLALDEAVSRLERRDPLAAEVVKLRYFAGFSMPEVAAALDLPLRTAERNWSYAKTWLHRDLG